VDRHRVYVPGEAHLFGQLLPGSSVPADSVSLNVLSTVLPSNWRLSFWFGCCSLYQPIL
jgi:hypothetical protein